MSIVTMSKLVIVVWIIWQIKQNSGNETNGKTCNCRNKSNCPLDNKRLINKIVYKAETKTNHGISELPTKVYLGIRETEFSPGTTTIQCHSEIGHTKIIPKFRNTFGV